MSVQIFWVVVKGEESWLITIESYLRQMDTVSGTDNEIIRVAPWELFDQSRCDANVIPQPPT